CLQYNNSPFTF
nr:immunoglobulin light chain junction region [Macaca mulatta]MOW08062.1 immunoglobulin light chain junction region [Macaca mulatta]MOW08372.1 immunoglobulin light chain junction region [Macaca mulatta]MOW08450.1 immunoglobulin light chain junction region [Macaca mulatta]MOW08603.1 immunoglobulin light chain junction region [Macaca mulatta]